LALVVNLPARCAKNSVFSMNSVGQNQVLPLIYLCCQSGALSQPSPYHQGLKRFLTPSQRVAAMLFITFSQSEAHPRLFGQNASQDCLMMFSELINRYCFTVLPAGKPDQTTENLARRLSDERNLPILELRLNPALSRRHYACLSHFLACYLPTDVLPICLDSIPSATMTPRHLEQRLRQQSALLHQWDEDFIENHVITTQNQALYMAFEAGGCRYPTRTLSLKFSDNYQTLDGFAWLRYPDSLPMLETNELRQQLR